MSIVLRLPFRTRTRKLRHRPWQAAAAAALVALALHAGPAAAATPEDDDAERSSDAGGVTGLPLPRFVSLGSDKVNVRSGPGSRYPISWVYVRRGLPVEVVAEFELYRKIRDTEGVEGWVHKSLLSGRRTVLISGAVRSLHREPDAASPTVALAEPGVQGRLLGCRADWCELDVAGRRGFARRDWLYGVYPGESFD